MWIFPSFVPFSFDSQHSGIRARFKAAARDMRIEGNFVQLAIPRFDGHYDHWSMLMEKILRFKEYWSLVETGYVEPESGAVLIEAQ